MNFEFSAHRLVSAFSTLAACSSFALVANAGFTNPQVPVWRGMPNTEYGGFETFVSASLLPNPPDDPNSNTLDAALVQLDTTAFLTGGNIYSFSAPLRCVLSNTVSGSVREVVLQVATRGTELDYSNARLEYLDAQGAAHSLGFAQRSELARIALGGQGFAVETMFRWDLGLVADAVGSFELRIEGAVPSMSLDALLLDVRSADLGSSYCVAKVNSLGCSPTISASGVPSASLASGFLVTADDELNNKPGLLLYSTNGRGSFPFGGGVLCMTAPIRRSAGQNSGGNPAPLDCSGRYSFDFNARIASGLDPTLVAGAVVQFQYWSRDSGFPSGFNIGLTDAFEATIQP